MGKRKYTHAKELEPVILQIPKTFREDNDRIDNFIHFYNHERIQLKTGVAPLSLRRSA